MPVNRAQMGRLPRLCARSYQAAMCGWCRCDVEYAVADNQRRAGKGLRRTAEMSPLTPAASTSGLGVHRQFGAVWMYARRPEMRVDLYPGTTG